jgi:hypothetical protein
MFFTRAGRPLQQDHFEKSLYFSPFQKKISEKALRFSPE